MNEIVDEVEDGQEEAEGQEEGAGQVDEHVGHVRRRESVVNGYERATDGNGHRQLQTRQHPTVFHHRPILPHQQQEFPQSVIPFHDIPILFITYLLDTLTCLFINDLIRLIIKYKSLLVIFYIKKT